MGIRVSASLLCLVLVACEGAPPSGDATPATSSELVPPAATPAPTASAQTVDAVPDKIAAQHVLVAYEGAKNAPPEVKRSKAEAQSLAEEILKQAMGGKDFAELAKEHSDDPGSAARLGSVGTFTREKMHEKFSDAAFALKVNELSPVVETPFGFHIIKRNQ